VRQRTSAKLSFFVLLMLFPFPTTACTYFPPKYDVGTQFSVKVSSASGLTLPAVRVILVEGNRVTNSVHTNAKGIATFESVQPGTYTLEVDQLGTAGWDTAELSVLERGQERQIELRWPSAQILRATNLKGILLNAGSATPLEDTSVVLVNAIDGALIARDLTQKKGEFDLGRPESGFYFLRIDPLRSGDWEPRGEIPVLVANGQERNLTLAVQQTSCGMQYTEVRTAPMKTVSHLVGNIVDSSGAVIGRARIELLQPPDKRILAAIESDKNGHFDFQYMPVGGYQLRVSAVGFAPTLVPINLVSEDKSKGSIDLQLNVIGSSFDGMSGVSSDKGSGVK